MAKPTQKSLELAELIRRSDAARFEIGQGYLQVRRKLDIPLRVRDSLKSSPIKWLGGSLGAGFVASLLFRSKRREVTKEKKHRGWLMGSLMMLFTLAKPAMKIYATKLIKDYLENQLSRSPNDLISDEWRNPY